MRLPGLESNRSRALASDRWGKKKAKTVDPYFLFLSFVPSVLNICNKNMLFSFNVFENPQRFYYPGLRPDLFESMQLISDLKAYGHTHDL